LKAEEFIMPYIFNKRTERAILICNTLNAAGFFTRNYISSIDAFHNSSNPTVAIVADIAGIHPHDITVDLEQCVTHLPIFTIHL
jgi:hypothetical protein